MDAPLQSVRFQHPVQTIFNDGCKERAWNRCVKNEKCESEVLTLLDVVKTTSGRAFFVCGNFTSLSGLF